MATNPPPAAPAPTLWGTSDDIEQYRRDIGKFFDRLAAAAEGNPPPGMNAANGFFVKAVQDDAELKSVAPPRKTGDDPEGQRIFAALASFEAKVLETFKLPNAHGRWSTNAGVAWDAFQKLKNDIPPVITAIGGAVATVNPATIAALAESVKSLIDKIHNAGVVYEGDHANGYIQSGVHDAAVQLKDVLDDVHAHPVDPFAGKFAQAMSAILDKLIALNFENNPWLRGEWQVSFQAITRAGALQLYALTP
ncbi:MULTISPECIES: hypothetical protein [unclassified Sphingomonas]|uniref:hypothetical protein n=1 Tax=unclassified Sphingomonas TaxID=196159 RepID=UPI00226A55C4|nr:MULTISPECIES: hypothetical protein [unclassified Sphingomonas]